MCMIDDERLMGLTVTDPGTNVLSSIYLHSTQRGCVSSFKEPAVRGALCLKNFNMCLKLDLV